MEYVENVDWKVLIGRLVEADIKLYMFQMLKVRGSTLVSVAFSDDHGDCRR